jgi:hypothetical protein
MGGYGSRRNGFCLTDKLDDRLKLKSKLMFQNAKLGEYRSGSLYWSMNGKRTNSISYNLYLLDPDDLYVIFRFNVKNEDFKHKVEIVTTAANFGGVRFWVICPITGKRSTTLYFSKAHQNQFVSRHALGLKYQSQSEDWGHRLITKKNKIRKKLGGEDWYIKPKGMHQKTYDRLRKEYDKVEEGLDQYMLQTFPSLY